MQERPERLNAVGGGSETTLVSPRFDDEEARRAHPVVPLEEARLRAPFADARAYATRAYARGGGRRSLTPALMIVALLASAAVGGAVATKVFPGAQSVPAAVQAPAETVPTQAAEAQARPETPPVVDAPREVAGTKPEARAPRVTRARRTEDAGSPAPAPAEAVRHDAEDSESVDEGRRGRGRGKRRERVEYDGEKEIRRALKRAKDKAPRLVDVLVSPR
jgi:hypothetical protein